MTIADLQSEAESLILDRFDEGQALALGLILVDLAKGLSVVINIRSANRTLFHVALPGSAPLNDLWVRRKSKLALLFQEASLLVGTRNQSKGETLARHGLNPAHYADNGGAVPVVVRGAGVVAVATVSGLPQVEDHRLVVQGLRALIAAAASGE